MIVAKPEPVPESDVRASQKEAIAHYTEIVKELRLALMEVGRRLGMHIRRGKREAAEAKPRGSRCCRSGRRAKCRC